MTPWTECGFNKPVTSEGYDRRFARCCQRITLSMWAGQWWKTSTFNGQTFKPQRGNYFPNPPMLETGGESKTRIKTASQQRKETNINELNSNYKHLIEQFCRVVVIPWAIQRMLFSLCMLHKKEVNLVLSSGRKQETYTHTYFSIRLFVRCFPFPSMSWVGTGLIVFSILPCTVGSLSSLCCWLKQKHSFHIVPLHPERQNTRHETYLD